MIKKLKQIFSSDFIFYGSLILFIVFIGQLPIFLHYFRTPAGYYYPLLDRPAFSDYYYLGLIRYAMGPEWLLKIPYVIYDHQASIIQIFYVFLGKLSLVTGIGPAEMFAIFRVVGGLLFAVSVVFLLKTILSKNQAKLAFIFFLLAQPLPALDFFSRTGSDFDNWVWHFGEAARRISAMPPHYTFGKGLTILSLVFLLWGLKKRSVSVSSTPGESFRQLADAGYPRGVFHPRGVLAALLIFLAGIIYPPPVFIALVSLTIAFVFCIFARGPLAVLQGVPFKNHCKKLMGISIYLIALILPLIILKFELTKGYPWDMWNKVELEWNSASMQFEWGYVRMLGMLAFFVVVSYIAFIAKSKVILASSEGARPGSKKDSGQARMTDFLRIFIFIWFLSSFLLFPFANILHLGKFRFIEGAQIVPLSILATWGWQYIKNKKIKTAFLVIFIANFLLLTILAVRWSTVRLWPLWRNVYFQPEELSSIRFIQINVKSDSIVLADVFSSNYLPSFARVRTIIGFPDAHPKYFDFLAEQETIEEILKGNLSEENVRDYLTQKDVSYVYRRKYIFGDKILYPRFLQIIYANANYDVYKITL